MKKSVIIDILNGKRGHAETMHMPKSDDGNADILCRISDELKEKLPPELFELHQKFIDALQNDLCDEMIFISPKGLSWDCLLVSSAWKNKAP